MLDPEYLHDLINVARKHNEMVMAALVLNVIDGTENFDNYTEMSVTNEFISHKQHEDIRQSLWDIGIETISYFDEVDFINDFLNNKFSTAKRIIVINFAQKGIAIGRKSLVPSFCDLNKIWRTGSNAFVVSLCRSKFHSNVILKSCGLPVAECWLYDYRFGWLNDSPPSGLEIIMKLNYESSSIGLNDRNIFCYSKKKDNHIQMFSESYKQSVLLEQFVRGYEVEVPVIYIKKEARHKALAPVGIMVSDREYIGGEILDYKRRYADDYTFYLFSDFNNLKSEEISKISEEAARILDIDDLARVDFRIDHDMNLHIMDIATSPYLLSESSFEYAFKLYGLNYKHILQAYIGLAILKNLDT